MCFYALQGCMRSAQRDILQHISRLSEIQSRWLLIHTLLFIYTKMHRLNATQQNLLCIS